MNDRSVSVVTVTVDNEENVKRLIESARGSQLQPAEIVVVNNGRRKLAQSIAEFARGTQMRIVPIDAHLAVNVSAARNCGWQATSADAVLFVDDDNSIDPNTLSMLQRALTRDPLLGAVAPTSLLGDSSNIWCAGVRRSPWTGRSVFLRKNQCAGVSPTDDMPNAFCVRRSVLELVGGFDSINFPMHREEADLTVRIQKTGCKTAITDTAVVWHHTSDIRSPGQEVLRIAGNGDLRRLELWARSRAVFHRQHSNGLQRFTTLGFGVPIWGMFTVMSILRLPASIRWKGRVLLAVLQGLMRGYTLKISQWPADFTDPSHLRTTPVE